ncbi:MAG TPA: hypothetical protein V6C58_17370, partial [Allocoleopsis sp.]
IKDQIFYYKAKPRDFRMCSEKLWRLDEEKKLRNAYSSNKIITSSFTYSKGNDKKKIVIKKRK